MVGRGVIVHRGSMVNWGSFVDWSSMVDRSSLVDRGSMVDRGSLVNNRGSFVNRGSSSFVNRGSNRSIAFSLLWILGHAFVGDSLCPAIGQSHLVSSISIVTITLLMGIEVGGRVVVLDSVGVLVHWGEVRVGGLSGVGGGSGRGSAGTGQKGS